MRAYRLRSIDLAEAAVRRKEEARNALEAYLYRLRDLLEEEGDTPFRKCSRQEERQTLNEKLEEAFGWLHGDGDDAKASEYVARREALE